MTRYQATDEDMREYSRIIASIAQLDLQRQQYTQALAEWERSHAISEEAPAEASE